MRKINKKKVVVAMSGGVDSSVAAALLKSRGFKVEGIFLKLADLPSFKKSEKQARKIAEFLKIPFSVFDLRQEFKKKVISYFLKEYKLGRTPNPCVLCNKEIKFGALLKEAKKRGADFLATGHYARRSPAGLRREIPNSKFQIPNKSQIPNYKLLKARDKEKDQSYFLWQLNQRQLRYLLFPLGARTKNEVRNLAKKFGILKFVRPPSREICFISGSINDFLKKNIESRQIKKGKIVNTKGEIIGEHQGLVFYTIGQRSGIGLSAGPFYVLNKDFKKNILVVTKKKKDLEKTELALKKVNWLSKKALLPPIKIKAKFRYRGKEVEALIKSQGSVVIFKKPQKAIAAGQSVVFYLPVEAPGAAGKGRELLGGGIIY